MRGYGFSNYDLELLTSIEEKMVKVGGVKIYDRFSYLLNKLIFSICLKGGKGLRVVDLVVK